jgi:hypothetical protein
MKTTFTLTLVLSVLGIALASATSCFAQTQTITLAIDPYSPYNINNSSYAVATNQIVQIKSLTVSSVYPAFVSLYHSSGITVTTTNLGTYTGLTNISLGASSAIALATFEITTPTTATVVSNYVPADAIVIPASATGNVQIILESSPDLVNWTAANPGIYGPSAGTNRFFRVRAAMIP